MIDMKDRYDYASIPLEVDAYELQREFESSPQRPLSVESEIKRRLVCNLII